MFQGMVKTCIHIIGHLRKFSVSGSILDQCETKTVLCMDQTHILQHNEHTKNYMIIYSPYIKNTEVIHIFFYLLIVT
jgi:hypothetical protein